MPVAEELGKSAVRDAELGEEAHGVDGVNSAAAGALRPLPLLSRPGRAVARRGGGRRRVATEQVTMPPSGARATASWEVGAPDGWVAVGVDEERGGTRGHEEQRARGHSFEGGVVAEEGGRTAGSRGAPEGYAVSEDAR